MQQEDEVSLPRSLPSRTLQVVGVAAGLVPFVISSTHVETVNGVVTSYRDNFAIGGGGLAAVIGAIGLFSALRGTGAGRGTAIGLAVAALLLGALQLARGLGVFA